MKYIKQFPDSHYYFLWKESDDYVIPNVCLLGGAVPVYNAAIPAEYEGEVDLPLYFEALEDGLTMLFSGYAGASTQYSLDNLTWVDLPNGTYSPSINTGERIYFRAYDLDSMYTDEPCIGSFSASKKHNLGGNIMSMLHGDDFKGKTELTGMRGFCDLFFGCDVVSARNLALPATTLIPLCYCNMFGGCEYLIDTPMLPATTLAEKCYYYMYTECTSLTIASTLPAMNLAPKCYDGMYYGCECLILPPQLPATILATQCYQAMFADCESLIIAPALPATTLVGGCYQSMFDGCWELREAPVLPALKLEQYCYQRMFRNCNYLKNIKMLATDVSANNCMDEWVKYVSDAGKFIKNKEATWDVTGDSGVPSGWTIEYE